MRILQTLLGLFSSPRATTDDEDYDPSPWVYTPDYHVVDDPGDRNTHVKFRKPEHRGDPRVHMPDDPGVRQMTVRMA